MSHSRFFYTRDKRISHMQTRYESAARILQDWCLTHDLPFPDDALARTALYLERLIHYQKQTNLTGFNSPEDIVTNLCIDSLQILRAHALKGPVLDVGTGAGFPAIPIKIVCPHLEMLLVEPRTKRYAFLRLIERDLGLENIQIFRSKIESVPVPKTLGTAISKALMPIRDWALLAKPWAINGAKVACLISRTDWLSFKNDLIAFEYDVCGCVEEADRVYLVLTHADRPDAP